MRLHNLRIPKGAKKKRKRIGRGPGSGHGGTSCKGHKGQKARSKGKGPLFEGGQTPLSRRTPKIKGFTSLNRKVYQIVNLFQLNKFPENSEITPEFLTENKSIKKVKDGIKILGSGNIDKPMVVKAHKFSKSAIEKIKKAGGKAVELESTK